MLILFSKITAKVPHITWKENLTFVLVKNTFDDSNFSLLHINACSLQNKIDNLLQLLNTIKLKFTVIAISETWANDNNQILLNIPGYKRYLKSRSNERIGGGVAMFVKEHLSFVIRDDLDDLHCNDVDAAFINTTDNSDKITVGVVYRPPGGDLNLFNDSYAKLLDKLVSSKCKCIIAGDFNINLLNYENHSETENFLNNLFSHLQYPVITRPTRFCSTTSTLIDNIFVDNSCGDHHAGIFISDISDHLPIFYISSNKLVDNNYQKIITQTYRDTSCLKNIEIF